MKTFKNFLVVAVSILLAQIGWGQVPFTSTTSGAGTWTSDYDCCVTIELWGGGGGYVKFTMTVTIGATYNFSIGAGGIPVAGMGSSALSGGDTWFSNNTYAVAKGGKGGVNYNSGGWGINGAGGAGGTGNTVPVGGSGANGGNGSAASSSTAPGAGGEAGGANESGVATNGNAASGSTRGSGWTTGGDGGNSGANGSSYGGGAGGTNATSGRNGGVGAIKITAGGSCAAVGCAHNGSGVQLAIFEIPAGAPCGSGAVNVKYGIVQVTNGISTSSTCGAGSITATSNGSMTCVTASVSGLTIGKNTTS